MRRWGLGWATSVGVTVVRMSMTARQKWLQPQITIVVDEIGFLSGENLDKAYKVGEDVRNSVGLDMAGVQWLVFGDVLQLGPVPEWEVVHGVTARKGMQAYVFDSQAWAACCFACVLLVGSLWAHCEYTNQGFCPSQSRKHI
jgi:hypothetical protein